MRFSQRQRFEFVRRGWRETQKLMDRAKSPDRDPRITRQALLLAEPSQFRRQHWGQTTLCKQREGLDAYVAGHAPRADVNVHNAALVWMEVEAGGAGGGSKADH